TCAASWAWCSWSTTTGAWRWMSAPRAPTWAATTATWHRPAPRPARACCWARPATTTLPAHANFSTRAPTTSRSARCFRLRPSRRPCARPCRCWPGHGSWPPACPARGPPWWPSAASRRPTRPRWRRPAPTALPSSTGCSRRPIFNRPPRPARRRFPLLLTHSRNAMSSNAQLFDRACRSIPGGVNSPVRAFRSVGGTPRFIKRAQGPYVWDEEGTRYIDYVGSWGPAILGHAHPDVVEAVRTAALDGLSFGAPTKAEVELAEVLIERLPSLERVRLVSSGTEATMTAIRLARGATGRAKIVKFEGCYHGHSDSLLVKAGSGLLTLGNPSSAGVPPEFVAHTLTLEYNNLQAVQAAFDQHGADIACVIVEPVAGNMNLIKPAEGFLQGLRDVCSRHGAVLIFDEVMTGFRVGPQGVQGLSGVTPDLTT